MLTACGGDDDEAAPAASDTAASPARSAPDGGAPAPAGPPAGSSAGPTADDLAAVAATYADLVDASYHAAIASATEMQTAIEAFVADPTDATLAAAKERVARRPRRLRPDRGVPLLRRPDRQPRRRARGPDQRLADGRGLRRLRRGRRRRPASSTTPPATPRSPPTCSSRPTKRAARPTSPPAGTPSSSCSGARTSAPTAPAHRPVTDYTTAPNAERRATYLDARSPSCWSTTSPRSPTSGRPTAAPTAPSSSPIPTRRSRDIFRGIGALSAASSPASGWPSPTRPRTRRTSTPASATTPTPTSPTTPVGVQRSTWPSSPASTARALRPGGGGRPRRSTPSCRTSWPTSVQLTEAFPAPFEQMIPGPDDDAGAHGDARRHHLHRGPGSDLIAEAADALGIKINLEV